MRPPHAILPLMKTQTNTNIYAPLPPRRNAKIMRLLKKLWRSPKYSEMRFFQFVEVLGTEYQKESGECDLWNLYDEKFAAWLKIKISQRSKEAGCG